MIYEYAKKLISYSSNRTSYYGPAKQPKLAGICENVKEGGIIESVLILVGWK